MREAEKMRHIEEITITVKGLSPRPETFVFSEKVGRELISFIKTTHKHKNRTDTPSIAAASVLAELADDNARPAAVLRGFRHRDGLTQKQLAEKLDIRQHHLSEMENGKRPISRETAKKLAEIFSTNWKNFL